jgi:hypothetical protein
MGWLTVKLLAYVSGALLLACILLSAALYASRAQNVALQATHAAEKATAAQSLADQRTAFEAAAREAEQAQAKKYAEVEARHQKELDDAKSKQERTVADLRAGNLRLRNHWQGCQATGQLSSAAARAAFDAEAARLRIEGAAALIGLADQCDTRIRGLQGLVR